jgi:small subunit ribosomal protein S4
LKAQAASGITGEICTIMWDLVLDNVVYRMGVSNSKWGSSISFSLGHIITVKWEIVNMPSYSLQEGDVICRKRKSKSLQTDMH